MWSFDLKCLDPIVPWSSVVLTHGHTGQFLCDPTNIGTHANVYVVYNIFLMFKHSLFLKYQHNKYMFNLIDIYIILHVSGCVGRGPSAFLFSGSIMPLRPPCLGVCICER